VQRWRVGQIEIVRIVDEEVPLPPDALAAGWAGPLPGWCEPRFATDEGVLLAFSALAIRAPDGTRIVVDPWLVNDAARTRDDAEAHLTSLLDELTAAGFAPHEVDLLVLSHVDGVGWITRPDPTKAAGWTPTFPNARYVITADELEARRPEPEFTDLAVHPLVPPGAVELTPFAVRLTHAATVPADDAPSSGTWPS
jgi:hypothetical protein